MIENLLTTCGLNQSEQKVLLYLLQRGQTTASIISKKTNLKRPTVYAILENLIIMSLVSKMKRTDVTYFMAASPENIPKILERRAESKFSEIQSATKLMKAQLSDYAKKNEQDFGVFEIQAVESLETAYAELETALGGGDYCSIFNPQVVFKTEAVKKIGLAHLREAAISKPMIRDIIVSGPMTDWFMENAKNPNHKFKTISEDKQILSDMIFIKGSVYLIHYDKGKEVAIKITQPDFYKSMTTVFDMLWEKLD